MLRRLMCYLDRQMDPAMQMSSQLERATTRSLRETPVGTDRVMTPGAGTDHLSCRVEGDRVSGILNMLTASWESRVGSKQSKLTHNHMSKDVGRGRDWTKVPHGQRVAANGGALIIIKALPIGSNRIPNPRVPHPS